MKFNVSIDLIDKTPQETIESLNLSNEHLREIWYAVFHDLLTHGIGQCQWTLDVKEVVD